MLLTAIENLTSRALQETGQHWESMDTNILHNVDNKSNVKDSSVDMILKNDSTDDVDLEIEAEYINGESIKSSDMYHSNGSSGSSSNSFLTEDFKAAYSDRKSKETTIALSNTHQGIFQYNDRNLAHVEHDANPSSVINNISYKLFESSMHPTNDNTGKNTKDISIDISGNNNKDVGMEE